MADVEELNDIETLRSQARRLLDLISEAMKKSDMLGDEFNRLCRLHYKAFRRWVRRSYPWAKQIIDRLEDLMHDSPVDDAPNLLVIGDSNNGKTEVLRAFESRYPVGIDEDTCLNIQPVVFISATSESDESAFFIRLLHALYVPFAKKDSAAIHCERATQVMRIRKTRMIIIDNMQYLIAGSYDSKRAILNCIKDLGEALNIPIVCAVNEDAFHLIQIDPQLASHFKMKFYKEW